MVIEISQSVQNDDSGTNKAPTGDTSELSPKQVDRALRPQMLAEYVGQPQIKKNLQILLDAAKVRKESVDHVMLYGSAGLGKTTLAHIIAREMGVGIKVTSGPAIERVGDLGSILTNLSDGDVLFIDEIHRLKKTIEEVLYPAMEDGVLDIIVGKGPSARTLQLDLPRFTLIGATTQMGALSNPLRNRFGVTYRLAFYDDADMNQILLRAAKLLEIVLEPEAVVVVTSRARQTPRVANRLLRRVRDFAQTQGTEIVSGKIAQEALEMLAIDEKGFDDTDRQILITAIEKFGGGPVGVKTLATAMMEEVNTIEDVYEPYLIQQGMMMRTPRGRVVTPAAFTHVGIPISAQYRATLQRLGISMEE